MTHSTLQELVDITNGYSFDFISKNDTNLKSVLRLRKRILNERKNGDFSTIDRFARIFYREEIKEFFGVSFPSIDDPKYVELTDHLTIDGKGRVYGLQLTELSKFNSFKYGVMAGLFLMRVLTGALHDGEKKCLTDCGNFNSAEATGDLAKKVGLEAVYYMPSSVSDKLLDNLKHNDLLIFHERKDTGLHYTNACYATLIDRLRQDKKFESSSIYLGHSELGWASMWPFASRYKQVFEEEGIKPDILLSPVGAGTFFVPFVLNGFADENYLGEFRERSIMSQNHALKNSKKIVIRGIPGSPMEELDEYNFETHRKARGNLGREFEENPFIPKEFWKNISHYCFSCSEAEYKMLVHLRKQGIEVGMSSAGVIAGGRYVAQETGKTVVVPIFEDRLVDYSPSQ